MPSLPFQPDFNALKALRLSESRYRRLFETARDGILLLNPDTAQIEDVNPFLINILGYSYQEFLGKKLWEVGAFTDTVLSKEMFQELQEKGFVRYDDLPLKTKTGLLIPVEFVSNSYECEGIKVIQCNIRDGTERKAYDEKIQRHIHLYMALSKCNKAIIQSSCKEDLFLQVCKAAVQFGGMKSAFVGLIDPETFVFNSIFSFGVNSLSDEEICIYLNIEHRCGPINIAIREDRPYWCQNFLNDPLIAQWRDHCVLPKWASSASLPLHQNGVVIGAFILISSENNAFDEAARNLLVEMSIDISFGLDNITREAQQKQSLKEIEYLAFYDSLTNLPNRRLLHSRLQNILNTKVTHPKHNALLILDLDHFKFLNDTMGHSIGDLLLIEVASRLKSCMHDQEATVARLGGDEFVILLENLDIIYSIATTQAEALADQILVAISQPYLLKNYQYHGSTSIGICMFSTNNITESELLKLSDTAMYQAKNAGGNTKRFSDSTMQEKLEIRVELGRDLRCALKENQLILYYQIQVDNALQVFGAEALIRWQHPKRGIVSPFEFIPLAEEMGLITPIGYWVLEKACVQLKLWESDPLTRDLLLAVNISSRQFYQIDFVDQVISIVNRIDIDPSKLKLEITESVVMDDINDVIIKMNALRQFGVRFSLDDFGTGYFSLSYLSKLPLDQLKIDQSFVRNIGINKSDEVIVHTIIGMARNLGMEIIAEGVETKEQLAYLKKHGCHSYQGYLFSKPVNVDLLRKLLKQHFN